jgi:uncharacterized Zn finger protein (UPF0148 family)
MPKFQTEGDWKCPKCGGVEFYKSRKEKTVTAARVTQYDDVRMCAKCDIPMESESAAKFQNSASGCSTFFAVLALLSFVVWIFASMFGL